MEFKDNHKKIKKALLKGGLVVASRGTGKTRALAEILAENRRAIVIVGQQVQFSNLRRYLKENYDFTDAEVSSRVLFGFDIERKLKGKIKNYEDVYADEYVHNPYKGPFYAAVTSFPFPVRVVK